MTFSQKILTVIFLGILLFLLVGCVKCKPDIVDKTTELLSTPTLEILYKVKHIDAERGAYSWTIHNANGTQATINVDSSGPTELVKNSTPLSVSPGSTLALSFSDNPANIIINILKDSKSISQTITNNIVVTPESKGLVVYEVIATWNQGTVTYAFLVNVD